MSNTSSLTKEIYSYVLKEVSKKTGIKLKGKSLVLNTNTKNNILINQNTELI
ncbi:hypothetical protein CcarbDRAFT_0562 [Clostridium carboxidivorans P7]|uniref:Uncharacterized protein n=1 Tax=Clostridium carboxidivorans P7 TaxID=536227 RepID=C6PP45_9CLOT|nr:hypothetical protein [Clostridium carboxidivorans]EET88923.1 hypothetical protein CcarbDRAFT_0562 [Clostridium carboxidivorans P7]